MWNILPSTIFIEYEQQDGKKAYIEALYLAVLNRFLYIPVYIIFLSFLESLSVTIRDSTYYYYYYYVQQDCKEAYIEALFLFVFNWILYNLLLWTARL